MGRDPSDCFPSVIPAAPCFPEMLPDRLSYSRTLCPLSTSICSFLFHHTTSICFTQNILKDTFCSTNFIIFFSCSWNENAYLMSRLFSQIHFRSQAFNQRFQVRRMRHTSPLFSGAGSKESKAKGICINSL